MQSGWRKFERNFPHNEKKQGRFFTQVQKKQTFAVLTIEGNLWVRQRPIY